MEMSDSDPPETVSLETLKEENTRLKVDLEDCKIRLFELLYEDNQISDGTIRKEFEAICEFIDKWIDEVFKESDFTGRFSFILKKEPENLARFGLYPVADSEKESEGVLGMTWLGRKDTCSNIVLSLVIWRFLENHIFNEPFPIGTTKDQNLLFKEILILKSKEQDEGAFLTDSFN
jgi:hypothetical protein